MKAGLRRDNAALFTSASSRTATPTWMVFEQMASYPGPSHPPTPATAAPRSSTPSGLALAIHEDAPAVPELSAWATLILGFAGLGFLAATKKMGPRYSGPLHSKFERMSQSAINEGCRARWRYAKNPIPAKPSSIMAHVAGSGTVEIVAVTY